MAERGLNELTTAFQNMRGRNPTQQDIDNFIDPATGRIWGGLWDQGLENVIMGLPADQGSSTPEAPSFEGFGSMSGGGPTASLSDFFGEYQELLPQIMQTQQDITRTLFPESSKIRPLLASQVVENLSGGMFDLPDSVTDVYTRNIREAFSDRGLVNSPGSGRAEGEALTRLAMDFYNQNANLGLQLDAGITRFNPESTFGNLAGFGLQQYGIDVGAATSRYSTDTSRYLGELNNQLARLNSDRNFATTQQQLRLDRERLEEERDQGGNVFGQLAGGLLGSFLPVPGGTAIGSMIGGALGGGSSRQTGNIFGGMNLGVPQAFSNIYG